MSSPTVFTGSRTKFISSKGALLKDGSVIDNDGVPNFIKNGHAEINTTGWATFNEAVSGTTVASTNYVWVTFTDLVVGDAVSFPSVGTSGLSSSTIYYVIEKNTLTLKVSTTKGGSEFNITGDSNITIAKYRPLDGTGGTATSTWTRVTTNPLAGAGSFSFSKDAANRMGEGVSYSFTLDPAYRARVCNIQFDYRVISGTFVAGSSFADSDLIVYLYDVDNSKLIEPSSFKLLSNSSTISDTFQSSFQTSSNGVNYRLLVYCATASASAYAVAFDNVQVTPTEYAYGTPVTDWQSYTPTGSWTGAVTYTGRYRRVGDSAEIQIKLSTSGAPTGTLLSINLPSGLSIDTNKLTDAIPTGSYLPESSGSILDGGTALYAARVGINNSTSILVFAENSASTYVVSGGAQQVSSTVPITFGASDVVNISFSVPILGWSSSVQMSDQTSTRVVSLTAYRAGSAITATAGATTEVVFNTIETNGDTTGQYSTSTGRFTASTPGWYRVSSNLQIAMGATAASSVACYALKNGTGAFIGYDYTDNLTNAKTYTFQINDKVFLNSGDYISIWVAPVTQNVTVGYTGGSNHVSSISIERISGPNQIAASETVSALYTGAPPTGTLGAAYNTVTFGTKVKDSHGAYSSATYTVPTSGQYDISAALAINANWTSGNIAGVAIFIDNVNKYVNFVKVTASVSGVFYPELSVNSIPLTAGQTIIIKSYVDGTSASFDAASQLNFFSINRSGNY